jgi:hypothetical protein
VSGWSARAVPDRGQDLAAVTAAALAPRRSRAGLFAVGAAGDYRRMATYVILLVLVLLVGLVLLGALYYVLSRAEK